MTDTKEFKATELLAEVAGKIKESGPDVYNRLVSALVEKEITERVAVLDKALQKRQTLIVDVRKVDKPDNELFDAEGKLVSGTYSKARLEEIKKAKEVLSKFENALEKALTENDFGKLKEFCK